MSTVNPHSPELGLLVQELSQADQVLVLADLASGRTDTGWIAPNDINVMFDSLFLQRPSNTSVALKTLNTKGHVSRKPGQGAVWGVTPKGKKRTQEIVGEAISSRLASPVALWTKLPGVFIGTFALMSLNLVRIVSLYYVRRYRPDVFEFMHVEVWQALFIFLAVLFWALWAVWATRRG